jgi:uncharacterized membrane protein YqjE
MMVDRRGGSRSIGALLRDLADESTTLAHGELTLTKLELGSMVRRIGTATALVALGVVVILLGGLSLLVGVVLLIGDQWIPSDRYWVAALIMLLISGSLAAWLARRGALRLSPARLAPSETATTLKEDAEWLKRQLT